MHTPRWCLLIFFPAILWRSIARGDDFGELDNVDLVIVGFQPGLTNPENIFQELRAENFGREGPGLLTHVGKRQMHSLGKALRNRYGHLASKFFRRDEVKFMSSRCASCVQSMQSVLAGLFPPTGWAVWNPLVKWQPIPFNTSDEVLDPSNDPPCLSLYFNAWLDISTERMPLVKQLLEENRIFVEYLANKTGWDDSMDSLVDAAVNLLMLSNTDAPLPAWLKRPDSSLEKNSGEVLEAISAFYGAFGRTCAEFEQCRRFQGGKILNEIVDTIRKGITDKSENPRFFGYSMPSETLLALMKLLDLDVESGIRPGSGFVIEVAGSESEYPTAKLLVHGSREPDLTEIESVLLEKPCIIGDVAVQECPTQLFFDRLKNRVIPDWKPFCHNPARICGPNTKFIKCRLPDSCYKTCNNYERDPLPCNAVCLGEGCVCRRGFVRDSSGNCIKPSACSFPGQWLIPSTKPVFPEPITVKSITDMSSSECSDPLKEYSPCGSSCPKSCGEMDQSCALTSNCVEGTLYAEICFQWCFCKVGLILLDYNDRDSPCVRPDQCLKPDRGEGTCSDPMKVFKTCGSACPSGCDDVISPPLPCSRNCVAGCFCPDGLVLLDSTDRDSPCVRVESCPNPDKPENTCSDQVKVFNPCGSACPQPTCGEPGNEDCEIEDDCVPGCYCPPGTVLLNPGSLAPCVSREECSNLFFSPKGVSEGDPTETEATTLPVFFPTEKGSKSCDDPNKYFDECGSSCPEGCGAERLQCEFACLPTCVCRLGYVLKDPLDQNSECVRPESCSEQTETICQDPLKVFKSCGSACPPSCGEGPSACTLNCVSGCFCPDGYFLLDSRDKDSACVQLEECPIDPITEGECSDPMKIFSNCGDPCPGSCDGSDGACAAECSRGCFCPPGYVLLSSSDPDSPCVKPEECPDPNSTQICGDPVKTLSNCAPKCPESCGTSQCSAQPRGPCRQGCVCPNGMVLLVAGNRDSPCVFPDQCPSTPTESPEPLPGEPSMPSMPTSLTSPSTPANCTDSRKQCRQWAKLGECLRNPYWMKLNCQKSCKCCGCTATDVAGIQYTSECRDNNEFCPYWAAKGECLENPGYMRVKCTTSCGVCGVKKKKAAKIFKV